MAIDKPRCPCCADWYREGREKVRNNRKFAGDAPEELPHRRKRTKTGKPRAKDNHRHIYVFTAEFTDWVYEDYKGRRYKYGQWICAEWSCRKIKRSRRWRDSRVYI